MEEVRILHLSDTHNHHWDISPADMPPADIFIHTGDFSNEGTQEEFEDFDAWLGEVSHKYDYMIVIGGNHDWRDAYRKVEKGEITASTVLAPTYLQDKLRNATILDHREISINEIRIFGSSWSPWHVSSCPENGPGGKSGQPIIWEEYVRSYIESNGLKPCPHRYDEIPDGVDILLTHGPAYGILDCLENTAFQWGSSPALRQAIHRAAPRVHLFGHMHEQRGVYMKQKDEIVEEVYIGGVQYTLPPYSGEPAYTAPPPAAPEYPCQVISCNPMLNHSRIERRSPCIIGRPRLIFARRMSPSDAWDYSVSDEHIVGDSQQLPS